MRPQADIGRHAAQALVHVRARRGAEIGLDPATSGQPCPELHIVPLTQRSLDGSRPISAVIVDVHAHAGKRGCFFYGNALDSGEQQVENQLMALLLSVNSRHFDYSGCNFSPEHMHRVDKGEHGGMSAEVRARARRKPRARAATTTHTRSRALTELLRATE